MRLAMMRRIPPMMSYGILSLIFVLVIPGCDDDDVTGVPGNRSPEAMITADPTSVPANDGGATVVTLDGSQSSDPDGDELTFSWVVSGVLQFVEGTSQSSMIAKVTFPGANPYPVTLTVSDGKGGSDTANTTIGISN